MKPFIVPLLALALIAGLILSFAPIHGAGSPERHESRFLTVPQVEALIAQSPWPEYLWDDVLRVAACESAKRGLTITLFDTQARNLNLPREDSRGLLQINTTVYGHLQPSLDLYDPLDNLVAGLIVWMDNGKSFSPWSCRP